MRAYTKQVSFFSFLLGFSCISAFAQGITVPAQSPTTAATGSSVSIGIQGISGGNGEYFLTLVSANIPAGCQGYLPASLSISNSSSITASPHPSIGGTATQPGQYCFEVTVSDTTLPVPNTSAPVKISLTVTTGPIVLAPLPGPFSVVAGAVTIRAAGPLTYDTFSLANISGGDANYSAYTVKEISGNIPATVQPILGNAGTSPTLDLQGLFLTPGTYTGSFTASDDIGDTSAPATFTITVTPGLLQLQPEVQPGGWLLPGLTTASIIPAQINSTNTPLMPYASFGQPPYKWAIPQGSAPPGLSITQQDLSNFQVDAYALTGTPATPGSYSFLAQVTDSSSPSESARYAYTVSVLAAPQMYAVPKGIQSALILGPDGNFWFGGGSVFNSQAGELLSTLASISPSGSLGPVAQLYFPTSSTTNPVPGPITSGPDGSLWFVGNRDQQITGDGGPYVYQVHTDASLGAAVSLQDVVGGTPYLVTPTAITNGGAAGGVWFTGSYLANGVTNGVIGRIDPNNPSAPQFVTIPSISGGASQRPIGIIYDAADGNFWFLDQLTLGSYSTLLIGRISPSGVFNTPLKASSCPVYTPSQVECVLGYPNSVQYPSSSNTPPMSVGADGAIWFQTGNGVARFTTDGNSYNLYPEAQASTGLAIGSDHSLWSFVQDLRNPILTRTSPSGVVTTFNLTLPPSQDTPLDGIQAGTDGSIWLTGPAANSIIHVLPVLYLDCGNISANITLNQPASVTCRAQGTAPYTYSVNQANIPSGLTAAQNSDGTFTVSGTPTSGGYFTFSATDSHSTAQQANQVFNVAPGAVSITCTFPATLTAGAGAPASCTPQNGVPPYTYTAIGLPPGLTGVASYNAGATDPYTYQISGAIDPNSPSVASVSITATDSQGTVSPAFTTTLHIGPAPVALSCNPNGQAVAGSTFQQACFGYRGVPPYTYSAVGLPAGLTISPTTGVISGSISAPAGLYSASVNVSDSASGGASVATEPIAIKVTQNRALAVVCDFSPLARVGVAYSTTCTTSGGVAPYQYSGSGNAPPGLTISAANGQATVTPTAAGLYAFKVFASDSAGGVAQQSVNLLVHPATLAIITTTIPTPVTNLDYAAAPIADGGTPPYTFAITAGALPGAAITLNPGTGLISGPGGSATAGPFTFTLQVTDSTGATATQTYSGAVSATPLLPGTKSYAVTDEGGVNGVVQGPDGNIWFTALDQLGGNLLGNITTDGQTVATTPATNALTGAANTLGGDIAVGPDGNIWLAQPDGGTVAEQPTSLSAPPSTYVPKAGSVPSQLVAAPDGALWFTEASANQLGHLDASGNSSLKEIALPTAASQPAGIAVAADNTIWFTEKAASKIGRVVEDGTSAPMDVATTTPNSGPTSIVLGPDNALWFTESTAGKIGRIDTNANITEFTIPAQNAKPQAITVGGDGALYFTDSGTNQIWRMTLAGAMAGVSAPDVNAGLAGITADAAGNLWFAESALSRVGRLSLASSVSVTCTIPASPLQAGSAFSGACTASQGFPPYQYGQDPAHLLPPGVSIDPNSGALSGTLTAAGTFTFDVLVQDSSSQVATSPNYTFTVSPLPLTSTCTTPPAHLYSSYSGAMCSGVNGTLPYSYSVTSGALPPGISLDPTSGSLSGIPTTLGNFTFTVQVTDASTPAMTAPQNASITVEYGSVLANGNPLLTLSTLPGTIVPGNTLTGVTLTLNSAITQPLSGTVKLTFTPGQYAFTTIGGTNYTTPATYVDPSMQFVNSSGTETGTSYAYNFPATTNATSVITLPAINPGTVVGRLSVIVATDVTQTSGDVTIPFQAIVEPGSVQFTNVTSSGFDVEFIGIESNRAAQNATITFNPASGSSIAGQTTFHLDVSQAVDSWLSSTAGEQYGGRFSLTFPCQFDGSISAIGSVTVTLDGSSPVTGNR